MMFKFILTLISGLLTIFLGFFVYKKNIKSSVNISYFFLCLFGGGWGAVKAFQLVVLDLSWHNLLITKLVYFCGILAPLAYLFFAYYFPYRIRVYSNKKLFLIYLIPLVFILLVILGLLNMEKTQIINNLVYHEVIFFDFLIFSIYFFVYVCWAATIFIKKYLAATEIHKIQLKNLIIATFSSFITVGIVSVIMPLVYNFKYDWLGPIFLFFHLIIFGYYLFYKSVKEI